MASLLLTPNPNVYTVFANNYLPGLEEIIKMCDQQEANLWLASDINLTHDADDWDKLDPKEQNYLKQILAFFAASDGIVGENLAMHFAQQVQIPEVRYFYYFQMMMEAVHAKIYSQMINTFIKTQEERDHLFDSINNHPIIKKKAEWCFRWMHRTKEEDPQKQEKNFFKHLVAFLAVEGIFFAGSFAAIFWIRDRGYLANSLGVANEYISRDETLHAEFACLLVNQFGQGILSEQEIQEILLSALEIEKEFTRAALPDRLFGINQELMIQYLEYVTDMWLDALGCSKVFGVSQPFPFMQTIAQRRKDAFFEKTRTNYARAVNSQDLDFNLI